MQAISCLFNLTSQKEMKMNAKSAVTQFVQVHDKAVNIHTAHSATKVQVLRGQVWLTQAPAARDVLLKAGDHYSAPCKAGDVVIEAVDGFASYQLTAASSSLKQTVLGFFNRKLLVGAQHAF
jgi:ferric-dicitrate binding protein FerR (iron transport regulator)